MERHRRLRAGFFSLLLLLPWPALAASVLLSADDTSPLANDPNPTYSIIRRALGQGSITTPDCTHPDAGPHITREADATLGQVFVFTLHLTPDGSECLSTNHPRNEIKVDNSSPDYLKLFRSDRAAYRWTFRLPPGFQSSYNFTYIHQVKAVDGDFVIPLIAINVQKGRNGQPDTLSVNHADSNGVRNTLGSVPLTPFLGEWVDAYETMTTDTHGRYAITLVRVRDGAVLLRYSSNDIDMWRFSGTTFIRPKWGFYRSVDNPQYLRDDSVSFKQFCLAKGDDDCPAEGTPIPPPPAPVAHVLTLSAGAVTASASADSSHPPAAAMDGKLASYWAAQGDGQWLRFDLQSPHTLSGVSVAWYKGTVGKASFEVQVSDDGVNYTRVFSGQSSGTTTLPEKYDFPDVSARYVRIQGHGNSINSWNLVAEASLWGY